MQEEQPRRKPRVPLSPEELYYYKKIKQLNELKRVDDFKKTSFYKIVNTLNIILAAFLAYCVLSVLICSRWEQLQLASANCIYGQNDTEVGNRSIVEIQLLATTGELIPIKTSNLFEPPKQNAIFFVGFKVYKISSFWDKSLRIVTDTHAFFSGLKSIDAYLGVTKMFSDQSMIPHLPFCINDKVPPNKLSVNSDGSSK